MIQYLIINQKNKNKKRILVRSYFRKLRANFVAMAHESRVQPIGNTPCDRVDEMP